MRETHEVDEIFDASDPQATGEAEARQRRLGEADRNVLRRLLFEKAGRAWLYRQLDACGIFQSIYDDLPYRMYFREGERNTGLRLLANITAADPEHLTLMLKERGGE